jgi:hypothetical protein
VRKKREYNGKCLDVSIEARYLRQNFQFRNGRSFEIKAYHPDIYTKIRKLFGVRKEEFTVGVASLIFNGIELSQTNPTF